MSLPQSINLKRNFLQFACEKHSRIPKGRIFHAHQGMELYYVHEGNGRAIVENQLIELAPGTLLYFAPFQLHGILVDSDTPRTLVRSIFEFNPLVLEPYFQPFASLRQLFYNMWRNHPSDAVMLHRFPPGGEDSLQLERQLRQLHAAAERHDYEEHFALTVLQLLQRVLPDWAGHYDGPALGDRPLSNVELIMEWIESHYHEPFQLERLSRDIHLSPKYISSLFRKTTGVSITEYLMAKRLRQACRLLIASALPVEAVAHEVGIGNFSYFCKFFKQYMGISPMQYRKKFG